MDRRTGHDGIDRRVFAVDEMTWDRLQVLMDRPAAPKPVLTRLLKELSILEPPSA